MMPAPRGPRYSLLLLVVCCVVYVYLYTTRFVTLDKASVKVCNKTSVKDDNPVTEAVLEKFRRYEMAPRLKKLALETLLDTFIDIAKKENISWWMCAGTLIGSYRHHQMTPWEVDLDVFIMARDGAKLKAAITGLNNSDLAYANDGSRCIKFWHKAGVPRPKKAHMNYVLFPYIDIYFADEDATHILMHSYTQWNTRLKKSVIFPTVNRPFNDGRMLPGPHDPRQFLQAFYGKDVVDMCVTYGSEAAAPCTKLTDYYPVVTHTRVSDGSVCEEKLVLKGRVIGNFSRSASGVPVC